MGTGDFPIRLYIAKRDSDKVLECTKENNCEFVVEDVGECEEGLICCEKSVVVKVDDKEYRFQKALCQNDHTLLNVVPLFRPEVNWKLHVYDCDPKTQSCENSFKREFEGKILPVFKEPVVRSEEEQPVSPKAEEETGTPSAGQPAEAAEAVPDEAAETPSEDAAPHPVENEEPAKTVQPHIYVATRESENAFLCTAERGCRITITPADDKMCDTGFVVGECSTVTIIMDNKAYKFATLIDAGAHYLINFIPAFRSEVNPKLHLFSCDAGEKVCRNQYGQEFTSRGLPEFVKEETAATEDEGVTAPTEDSTIDTIYRELPRLDEKTEGLLARIKDPKVRQILRIQISRLPKGEKKDELMNELDNIIRGQMSKELRGFIKNLDKIIKELLRDKKIDMDQGGTWNDSISYDEIPDDGLFYQNLDVPVSRPFEMEN